jgi:hypothetical protein
MITMAAASSRYPIGYGNDDPPLTVVRQPR